MRLKVAGTFPRYHESSRPKRPIASSQLELLPVGPCLQREECCMDEARQMLEVGGIRTPAGQCHQGSKIVDVKYSSTPSKTIWAVDEGNKNHAELKLCNFMRARSEQAVQSWRYNCFESFANINVILPNKEKAPSPLPWRVLGSVTRCYAPSTRCWYYLNNCLGLKA